jgi:glutathione S-transferase
MTGKATLFFTPASPPARAAVLGIRVLGLDVELKNVNLLAGEQKSEEFQKLNPVGKVPVFVDSDGFTLSESRAILAYLVSSRSPESDLYPNDPRKELWWIRDCIMTRQQFFQFFEGLS